MTILPREHAVQRGFVDDDVLVPTAPRSPTEAEVRAVIATSETPYVFELTSLPAEVGRRAIELDHGMDFDHPLVLLEDCKELGPEFFAVPFGHRLDLSERGNVSVGPDGKLVGDHIDSLNPRQTLAVLNMGPGPRWHRFSPGFLRSDTDESLGHRPSRLSHMRELLRADEPSKLRAYWLRLNPPSREPSSGEETVECLLRVPAARYLHDGATLGSSHPSTAVFLGMPIAER